MKLRVLYAEKSRTAIGVKDDACAKAKIVLDIRSSVGKLRAQPVGLEQTQRKVTAEP